MNRKLVDLIEDPSGAFFKKYDSFWLLLNRHISSFYMLNVLFIRGVTIGSKCIFYGKSYFRRSMKSTITIGNFCRFRSSFLSNNVGLNRPCFISTIRPFAEIIIGNNVGMSGTVIGCAGSIKIGNNVLIGGNSFITDFDWHSVSDRKKLALAKTVIIEDDVFIGFNVTILKGVHIGKGSVVGANSVVTGSIPPGVVAAGNPCRIIKNISNVTLVNS